MSIVLTKQNEQLVGRLIRSGKYNNRSEVVRAALRVLEERELSYLNPPPLKAGELAARYRKQSQEENAEELADCKACYR